MAVTERKPVLIEALTYRVGHHSMSDDSTKYRPINEIELWRSARDSVARFRKWIERNGWWNCKAESELRNNVRQELLPLDDPTSNHLNILTQDPKFQSFLQLFQKGTTKIKTCLCNLIDSAASSSHSQDLIFLLGNSQKLLQEIIILLDDNNNNNNSEASMAAIKAISSLSTVEPNREKLVRAGAIDGIIRESGAAREEAIGEGVLSQLLLLLQSQCSARTKTKARMLLKLLRSKWVSENVPKQV
ncbi:2-oxoisovalerate dehydrogenase subunit alpha 2, mitochondrial-like isoform X3 [Senna tora]|uniref:2-oxoisovalerate dehydrogenase subunit alpha 2, mitochondrial-like isoform X3 n=1 Tax=Senna tora TaxID=362788 RepID=A0A834WX53_9FABA|nr:2-oxoisovalerate dehydrogenase subunit alpha 2, mitochondrial-like isoform X3 [Senna tora]